MRRVGVSIVAAILVACAGGAATGGAAANVDRKLTVSIQAGSGTVTSSPAGINCPQTCSAFFPSGTSVTLTATPATDFRFDEWKSSPVCTIQPTVPNECRINVSSDMTVGVVFRPAATLHVFPNGNGVVDVSPAGIDLATGSTLTRCDPAVRDRGCELAYLPRTLVTATATPGSGRTFAGWSNARCGAGPCTVEAVAGETSLVASFNPLELAVVVAGEGVVTSSPAGINCGDDRFDCAVSAPLGAKFVLDAGTATHEWRFGCEPAGGDVHAQRCTATVAGSPTLVGVSFGGAGGPEPPNRISIRLDLLKSGGTNAAVKGRKIDCRQSKCAATYKFGDMEELRPVDARGARFDHWINGCGTTRVCRFPVGPITSLEAVFAPPLTASIVRLRVNSQRQVVARIQVNRAARVSLRLLRNGRRVAKNDVGVKAGQTPVRVKVPRGSSGRFGVIAIVKAGTEEKRLVRSIQVGR
jgi:List-Bact-rpt repeat protein